MGFISDFIDITKCWPDIGGECPDLIQGIE